MVNNSYRPEWVPDGGGAEFTTRVLPATVTPDAPDIISSRSTQKLTVDDYVSGVLAGDRMLLARAITLVESNSPKHYNAGQEIIQRVLPHTGSSTRLCITGVPGAGKSTFIETLGCHLCAMGRRVAVLAVDPSSSVSKGSILGDKTRMENLSREKNAFIRPSPSSGTLGGVAAKSRETMLLCEAAGYDTILVETVGVGQSEVSVRSMVDFFMMLTITGAGDDLQGIKKGIIELSDAIVVSKADGDNRQKALLARADYDQILHFLRPATEGWVTKAHICSSLTGEGIDDIWKLIGSFMEQMQSAGLLQKRRKQQDWEWVQQILQENVRLMISQNPVISEHMLRLKSELNGGSITAAAAARSLVTITREALR